MSLFLYILVFRSFGYMFGLERLTLYVSVYSGMWSKVLGTCLCLERLTLYVFISVYSGFRHVVKSFGYMFMS